MDGGGQPPDTEMSEAGAGGGGQPPQQPLPPVGGGVMLDNIQATLSHGGRFIQYNIFGNVFEVTAKYKPPVLPIGKGAYGIVWSARSPRLRFASFGAASDWHL
jgi:mitogen-activated protein kinase 6